MKDLSMHILDIAQNSITAGAGYVEVEITENRATDLYRIVISDNGKGMTAEFAALATDAYVTGRTTRKVGLGLPLLKQNAERTGGTLIIESEPGEGTRVSAVFSLSNIDRPPLGDIAGTMVLLAAANLNIRFVYRHITEINTFTFDTKEVNTMLEGISISEAGVIRFLKEMISENLQEISIAG
ncbi:MAG: ATP-binding protein [Bacteroidota bacterium]